MTRSDLRLTRRGALRGLGGVSSGLVGRITLGIDPDATPSAAG